MEFTQDTREGIKSKRLSESDLPSNQHTKTQLDNRPTSHRISQLQKKVDQRLEQLPETGPFISSTSPIQRRLYGQDLSESHKNWNKMIDFYEGLPEGLNNNNNIQSYIDDHEGEMHEDWNTQIGALYGLKSIIKEEISDLKEERTEADNLGWNQIWNFLNGTLAGHGLVTATQIAGLGGQHGNNGFRWQIHNARTNDLIQDGSVPGNGHHGRNDGALNGARGNVRTAIDGHNTEIDHWYDLANDLAY
ncbi:MAG: hypothetical protein R8G66_24630 [Cytophagales bacterium]|nr:hypothetical protein [Cytophagales bacterium]